jgi:hypothetical protein
MIRKIISAAGGSSVRNRLDQWLKFILIASLCIQLHNLWRLYEVGSMAGAVENAFCAMRLQLAQLRGKLTPDDEAYIRSNLQNSIAAREKFTDYWLLSETPVFAISVGAATILWRRRFRSRKSES